MLYTSKGSLKGPKAIKLDFLPVEQLNLIKSIPFTPFCNVFVLLEDDFPGFEFCHYLTESKFLFTMIEVRV